MTLCSPNLRTRQPRAPIDTQTTPFPQNPTWSVRGYAVDSRSEEGRPAFLLLCFGSVLSFFCALGQCFPLRCFPPTYPYSRASLTQPSSSSNPSLPPPHRTSPTTHKAVVANAKGYSTCFAMPASIAKEKIDMMRTYGAEVILTPSVPFSDARHYFHVAAARGNEKGYFFTNQFENVANSRSHYEGTAPEICSQMAALGAGRVDGFVCASGTGGTIGGITRYLKEQDAATSCFLVDPHGSALFDYVKTAGASVKRGMSPSSGATQYTGDEVVEYIERSPGGSMTEGIGIDRVTANFKSAAALLDGAMQATDREAVEMAYVYVTVCARLLLLLACRGSVCV